VTEQEARQRLQQCLLDLLPANGSMVGNGSLLAQWTQAAMAVGLTVTPEDFTSLREDLVARGLVVKGKGRGGSTGRAAGAAAGSDSFALQGEAPTPVDAADAAARPKATQAKTQKLRAADADEAAQVLSYRHNDRRKNNPEVGLVSEASRPTSRRPSPRSASRNIVKPRLTMNRLDGHLAKDAGFGELGRLLDRSRDLESEVHRILGGDTLQLFDDSPRTIVALSAAQTSLEHGTALRVLLAQPLPTAGISMMRLQHEALARSAWLLYAASDEQIDRLVAPLDAAAEKAAAKLPMAKSMLDEIVGKAPHGAVEMLTHFKDVNAPALHSFVHGGIHAIQRGLTG
jgi:hypothetical protein